ncbi:hypothetical protein TMatcc_004353 [Talaromyces marneffei ATCC 18224]|uniref:uncharacterized protein n=1 Tax=Talaromyces marneffei TaxID=37727 RepID=UPI0012A9B7D4|nr:uncharacterized protein EYB26_000693 [Talaromyces marneffei]KAE8556935.1 hypothetical protein EYB25_001641 [Talaromyces marneffei]QGA13048.1 hypothetical protein EYB26_000693 [Talaromyces marneffei]
MGHEMSLLNNKLSHLLLLSTFSVLILLVTIDIYLSVLSPARCSFSSKPSSQIASSSHDISHGGRLEVEDEILGLGQQGKHGIVFHKLEALEDMSAAGDEKWDNLFPGDSYLFLNPENASFPQEPWGVSMFHGLHCLQVLRSKIQEFEGRVLGSEPLEKQGQRGHHHAESDDSGISDAHYLHCFSYLAQVRPTTITSNLIGNSMQKTDLFCF